VQKHRFTLPEIATLIASLDLEFLGFVLDDAVLRDDGFAEPADPLGRLPRRLGPSRGRWPGDLRRDVPILAARAGGVGVRSLRRRARLPGPRPR
jgi:hypothetical protein